MEEILKLREQFKSVQLQDSVHRLSERNCVEIIRKLLQQQKVQLIFTVDGKEYLTPQQLELEIKDEILSHGGRINVLDLQALLNVGLEHVEAKVAELVKKDKKLQMLHGDLITKNYLDGVAEELNEVIQEAGQLTLSDASKRFGLTSEFLHEALRERMGKIIHGSLENGMTYTAAFVQRYKAKMRGIFSAITKPTALTQLINDYNLQEKLFFGVLGELEKEGRLAGTIERGVYVPHIFAHARQKWISAFFEQNKYIEYQTLSKSSISDPRKYLQNLYPDGIALANCYVSSSLVKQIDASLEGYLLSGEDDLHKTFYVDVA
ncbi:E3 UFM1-protein ligase 1, partial [Balamuthia mandrillaris]